ncbi:ribonuclease H-like domain-containing protein [Pseudoxanthomonas sp. JBR18]|uniref:ribonuclease H-like domain-containing protein n=1 Tax=Pseudoxanthomonas sp. JBR18 TaxID=2969308 RepID=UPI00230654AF|nr:ribonuclease H-like domain-containing protein [Pseudoxanthomonas sp. JBR18]WCE05961.1 ribonuclease H-like domain-containing protein [Pseudoxanthomonas sp. JBR18]
MSINADRLRALRKQAGDRTVREAPVAQSSTQAPAASAAPVSAGVANAQAVQPPRRTQEASSKRTNQQPSHQLSDGDACLPDAAATHGRKPRDRSAEEAKPQRARSVLDWMDAPAGPAANEAPRGSLQPRNVDALRKLIATRERRPAASVPARKPASRDRQLPGRERSPGLHLIEAFLPQAIPRAALSLAFARRHEEAVPPRDLLFFDTETTGLAGGTGTRAFMIGAADWHVQADGTEGLRIRQLMMSTMAAEGPMLRTFAEWLSPSTVLCSYNGRSYDAPLLKARYRLARQIEPLSALDHVDLLHPTRRRYRGTWENCKLSTIERQLLRIVREDDLPGSEAPAAWLSYLRGGSARNLRRVAEHNHQDVVTLAQLLQRLVQAEEDDREVLVFEEAP